MKRLIFFIPLFLIVLFITLSKCDTSDYLVERKMWKIQQKSVGLNLLPEAALRKQADLIINQYADLIKANPYSNLVPQLYLQMGGLHEIKGDFDDARELYQQLLKKYQGQEEVKALVLMRLGLTYEQQKQDKEAIKYYRMIINDLPHTQLGFSMPVYMVNYYSRLGQKNEVKKSLGFANSFYKAKAEQHANTVVGFKAVDILVKTCIAQGKWQEAVDYLHQLLLSYYKTPLIDAKKLSAIIRAINLISLEKLHNPQAAIKGYEVFIKRYPDAPLRSLLESLTKTLLDSPPKQR